ncbi:TetR/AcrR family transcriptional regulator [Lentzea sp. NPDC055074]
MARLTRAEQQAQTHEHLLGSGREVFLRQGFLKTTVEEIAAEAGYTRGAVYKHFGGKEGLWLAIVEADTDLHLQGLRAALGGTAGREELIAVLAGAPDEARKWTKAAAEVLAATARQPEIATRIAALQARHDDQVVACLGEHVERLGITPALPLPQLVVMLGALGIGLALRQSVAPAGDPAAILAHVLDGALPSGGGAEQGGQPLQ